MLASPMRFLVGGAFLVFGMITFVLGAHALDAEGYTSGLIGIIVGAVCCITSVVVLLFDD
jgi:hypothetical protein